MGIGGECSSSLSLPSALSRAVLVVVERLLVGLFSAFSKLSVLPWTERGGVRGVVRCGRSVGRNAAGTYMGDFGGRSCRFARGRLGKVDDCEGEAGDRFTGVCGVWVVESMGDKPEGYWGGNC